MIFMQITMSLIAKSELFRNLESLSRSAHAMAVIWQSAWKHGNGDEPPENRLKEIPRTRLQDLYNRKTFVPSMRLSDPEGYKAVL
jgi:hypothetical protein